MKVPSEPPWHGSPGLVTKVVKGAPRVGNDCTGNSCKDRLLAFDFMDEALGKDLA